MYEKQILNALWRVERRLEILMSQQDEINADVTELDGAVTAIQAEIASLQADHQARRSSPPRGDSCTWASG